jgi:centractin
VQRPAPASPSPPSSLTLDPPRPSPPLPSPPAGFALPHAVVRSDIGGRDVTAALQAHLRRGGHAFHTSAEAELLRGLKEAACYVARNPLAEEAALAKAAEAAAMTAAAPRPAASGGAGAAGAGDPAAVAAGGAAALAPAGAGAGAGAGVEAYTLPDGSRLVLGGERFRAAEVLFQPRLAGLEAPGVHEAAAMAASRADLELRAPLLAGVVLTGGATATRGFGERLLVELKRSLPPDARVRITAPGERKVLPWVGGSILASLGTFRGMCVRREAWEESGAAALKFG